MRTPEWLLSLASALLLAAPVADRSVRLVPGVVEFGPFERGGARSPAWQLYTPPHRIRLQVGEERAQARPVFQTLRQNVRTGCLLRPRAPGASRIIGAVADYD